MQKVSGSAVTRNLRGTAERQAETYIIIIPKINIFTNKNIAVEIELEVVGVNETFVTTILKRKKKVYI